MKKLIVILIMIFISVEGITQTKLVVRGKAKDAKFIGSSIGGAKMLFIKKPEIQESTSPILLSIRWI